MKIKLIKLALCALTFGTIVNQSFAAQAPVNTPQPAIESSLWDKLPDVTVERVIYVSAGVAICYGSYKILSNETFVRNIKALYNLFTTGSVVSESEIAAKKARRATKEKAQQKVDQTLDSHSSQLSNILSEVRKLQAKSETLATKDDIEELKQKLDTIMEQTSINGYVKGYLAARGATSAHPSTKR